MVAGLPVESPVQGEDLHAGFGGAGRGNGSLETAVPRLGSTLLQPQQKLISKTRNGAKVSKKFDVAQTPYQRVLASPDIPEETKSHLSATYRELNPAQLKRDLIDCQDRLLKISSQKTRKEVKPPHSPSSKITYSWRNADILREATRWALALEDILI